MFIIILIAVPKSWGDTQDILAEKLISAIHDKSSTDEQLRQLEDKYKGFQIRIEGYVSEVRRAALTDDVTVSLKSDPELWTSDISFTVGEDDVFLKKAKGLKKGQKITVVGDFNDIMMHTIYLKNTRIYP